MWIVPVSKPFVRSSSDTALQRDGPPKPLAAFSTDRGAASSSLMSMRRGRQHDSEPYPVLLNCLPLDVAWMPSVRPGTLGASVVRSCGRAPRRAEMHTRQWIGTYAGKGNGDYRGELASALQAITTYVQQFAFSSEMALVRLDGQYGDASVVAQILLDTCML